MRRKILGYLSLSVGAVLALGACHRDGGIKTDTYTVDVEEKAEESSDDRISVHVSLEWPTAGASEEALSAMNSSIIGRSMDVEGAPVSIQQAVKEYIDVTVESFKSAYEAIKKNHDDDDEDWMGMSWEDSVEGYFAGGHKGVVSYVVEAYTYEGGANGLEGVYAVLFNLKDGKVITEDEYFVGGYEEELSSLLSSRLEESLSDPDDYNALFVKDIVPNGNFFVSESGVTYIYSPFEIGPHSLGTIRVNLPWEEVSSLVKKEYR